MVKIRIDIPNFHDNMQSMVKRPHYIKMLAASVKRSPVTALLGPRQCGKTTLARMFHEGKNASYFDLESRPDIQRLRNPELMLGSLKGLVVLDEIQAMPELFNVLRVLADRQGNKTRFLVLGSASPGVIKGASETLAGRVEFVELSGFDLRETSSVDQDKLWLRGGFPRSFLSATDEDSMAWREGFIRTFLERDIPQLGITIPSAAMRRFWTMLSHYHGQYWNGSELARSMGLSDKTVRSYMDILTGAYMIRQLQPWHENIGKRQVKAPKIYLRDSGLLHSLLGLPDLASLHGHPKVGASWEGFAIEQALQTVRPVESYFWATHSGAEIDLFFIQKGRRYGIEAKYNEAPQITRSMENSLEALGLSHLWIVYPGDKSYPVHKKISVCPLQKISGINKHIVIRK
jgi:predicted AAA+ superfamily ATPase